MYYNKSMQKFTLNFYASVAILAVGVISLIAFGFQQAQAAFQKGVVSGESIRVSEANACSASDESVDTPHFSGCNSIL
jgi:hypothetical protein